MYYKRLQALYTSQESPEAAAARKAAEAAARRASLRAPLVSCPGCSTEFVADLLDVHQRSCEPYELWLRKQAQGGGGGGGGGSGALDANGMVKCGYCSRTFFPDRLKRHEPTCKTKHEGGSGIRATMTDGETVTVGRYE